MGKRSRPRIRLIHWKPTEAAREVGILKRSGFRVELDPVNQKVLGKIRRAPPDAVVIDLSRQPAQGRDVAVYLRHHRPTRSVPLVFVGGAPDKVAEIRQLLPDATYEEWSRIRRALRNALATPVRDPVVFSSAMAAYRGTPLPKKLGIKQSITVALVGAPSGFERKITPMPRNVTMRRDARGRPDMMIWFVRTRHELQRRMGTMRQHARKGGLWIAWPKRQGTKESQMTQVIVRRTAEAHDLVDFKIASLDDTWSGLRFTERKAE